MTTKQLLSSNSYIQFPKFLGAHIGPNEALLLSVFCDRDSWCECNVEDYDGWFYMFQNEILWETGLSERQQRAALSHLQELHVISVTKRKVPARNFYFIDMDELENILNDAYSNYKAHNLQKLQNVTSRPDKMSYQDTTKNSVSSIITKNKSIKINNNAGQACASQPSTKRNFRKEHEQLTDELASGKVIDDEKREKKKKNNYEKCLDEISSRNFSDEVKELLVRHLDWSYNSKDPKRIRDRASLKHKLDFLEQLQKKGEDVVKVVQQSIDKQWHAFYEYKGDDVRVTKNEPLADRVVMNNPDEAREVLAKLRADLNRKVY